MRTGIFAAGICAAICLLVNSSNAQELSPRAYWPAPRGTKVMVFGYSHSRGDIISDPTLPITGVDSRIKTGLVGYVQTLGLWGRTANLIVDLPYSGGTTFGTLEGESGRRDFSGNGDLGIALSINLFGAPSMTPEEFQRLRANPPPLLGASLKILAPTGDYDADKLINVGANRWAVKVELGYMIPIKPSWLLEFELGAWFFDDNDEFLGVTREQRPIVATELHLVRRFKPGFWAALDLNFFRGGRSTTGGVPGNDLQRNSRLGGTAVFPFGDRHAVKVAYSRGVVTESGGDFDSFILSYNVFLK